MGEVARPRAKGVTLGERRGSGGHHPSGVCRNLFGTFDREENARFVKGELALIAERERERWNFDFKEEKPEEGRYEWTMLVEDPGRRTDQPGTSEQGSEEKDGEFLTQTKITDFLRKRKSAVSKKVSGDSASSLQVKVKRRAST